MASKKRNKHVSTPGPELAPGIPLTTDNVLRMAMAGLGTIVEVFVTGYPRHVAALEKIAEAHLRLAVAAEKDAGR
jgi:hypothetical protein